MAKTKIVIEKVANGYIFMIENNGYKAIAKDKEDVGKRFAEVIATSLEFADENHRAVFEFDAKLEIK